MRDPYPGYDVLTKRDTPSWNAQTRDVIGRRLAIGPDDHRFCNDAQWLCLKAICDRIVPQAPTADRPVIPVAALVDHKLHGGIGDGFRHARMPDMRRAWQLGLGATDAEAQKVHGKAFHALNPALQDALLKQMQKGELVCAAWDGMPCEMFFKTRVRNDIVSAYYSHPTAWSEIG
jgi:hypothetical protein